MRITRSIVPNLFTLANLFSGFVSIVLSSEGRFERAAVFILLAGIFDVLDGAMARLTKSTSEFGVELDSLCDAVSFGVAPSYMLYKVFFYTWGEFGMLVASLPALFGVLRLARFNTQLTSLEDKKYFKGLPIPANALFIMSFVVYYFQGDLIPEEYKAITITAVTVISSLVMVSKIKYENMPRPSLRYIKQNKAFSSLFLIAIIAVIITKGAALFPIMSIFILYGAIKFVFVKDNKEKKKRVRVGR